VSVESQNHRSTKSLGPLSGIRVLDLSRVLSGPHATRMLCDLGADVIKVEPPDGDITRFANPRINGLAGYFVQQNTGKRNVSLDMSRAEARELLMQLAEQSDVLIENFRPGVMDRMGIGYKDVSERNPGIIFASISGFGQTGPWVNRKAYAPVVGFETGLTKKQGDVRGGSYANDPFSHSDLYTGMQCAVAIVAALVQRERTGKGDQIDVAMGQTVLYVNEHVYDELWDGPIDDEWIRSFGQDEYPVLTAANGDIVIVSGHPAEQGNFTAYLKGAGLERLLDDPRMATASLRKKNFDVIMQALREWAATMPAAEDIEEKFSKYNLVTGQLRSVRELCDTDWGKEREVTVAVSDRAGGTIRIPNAPWRFSNSDVRLRGEPKYRGEDNWEVLRDVLGKDEDELRELDATGVLSSRVPRSVLDASSTGH
jgi:CoA:oxalate CoA-transferase